MTKGDYSFPASLRLKRKREFDRVFSARCSVADGRLVLYAQPNGRTDSRLGLVVSKRVGNAVTRNRIKRLLREAFRLNRSSLPVGYDFVCVPRPAEEHTLAGYTESLCTLAERAVTRWRKRSRK